MDYKKKYKNALEWARQVMNGETGFIRKEVEEIFPELKESEDEEIRKLCKELIESAFMSELCNKEEKDACINWIEKQGTQTPHKYNTGDWIISKYGGIYQVKEVLKGSYNLLSTKNTEDINSINAVDNSSRLLTVSDIQILEKQDEPIDKGEISDGYHTFNELYYYRMLYNAAFFNLLPKEWVHKSKRHHDGEECFGGGWFIVMAQLPTGQISNHYELKDWDLFDIPEKEFADEWDGHSPQKAAERLHKYLLEKQNDYKFCGIAESRLTKGTLKELVDNIEKPKFKEGDWIVFNGFVLFIEEVVQGYYRTVSIGGIPNSYDWDIDNVARLWTIQDAKDGDVLTNKNGAIFINAGSSNRGGGTLDCYCYLSVQNEFCVEEHKTGSWLYKDDIKPATKEQRELLFQKMEETGWSWNVETKELSQSKDSFGDVEQKVFDELLDNGKQLWSEEDEERLNSCLNILQAKTLVGNTETINTKWLKSLKERLNK